MSVRGLRLAPLLLGLALGPACGDAPPEERLAEAEAAVVAATEETKQAQSELETLRSRVEARAEELAEAERELARAQESLVAAAERAEARASDVALFRAVQSRLLEAEALAPFAVQASVRNRIVTLRGEVDTLSQAERAREIARETFGVTAVRSQLQVRSPERADAD